MLISSQVSATAAARGWRITTVGTIDQMPERLRADMPKLVLVDLSFPRLDVAQVVTLVREVCQRPGAVVAFGPHVQTAKLTAAAAAGCDRVLARGQLSRRLEEILEDYLTSEPPSCGTRPSSNG